MLVFPMSSKRLPGFGVSYVLMDLNDVIVDSLHDRGESITIILPYSEEYEVENLPDSIPIRTELDEGDLCVLPERILGVRFERVSDFFVFNVQYLVGNPAQKLCTDL